jgi:hypothetical protein
VAFFDRLEFEAIESNDERADVIATLIALASGSVLNTRHRAIE